MGMFDKDREIGLQMRDWIAQDEPFILYAVAVGRQVQVTTGVATETRLSVAKLDSPEDRFDVTTLSSPIATKAPEVEPEKELPAVVCWTKVDSKAFPGQEATVLRFMKLYGRPDPTGNAIADRVTAAGGMEEHPGTL